MFEFLKKLFNSGNKDLLAKQIKDGAFLVDVRSTDEFITGSVHGARNIPLNVIERQLSKFNNHEQIVVFCRSGNRSGIAKSILEQNGFKNVSNGGNWKNVQEIINHINK